MHSANTSSLKEKLNDFIRKYYKNQLVKGGIYTTGGVLAFYIVITTAEYIGHFSTSIRTFLFYGYLLISGAILVKFIVIPLLKLNKLGTTLSHNDVAYIVGKHFTDCLLYTSPSPRDPE